MRLGIMQPYFFPYIGYWQLINAVDKYVIYDDVNYIKGGWVCRNRILVNNEDRYFSLHTFGASPNVLINDVVLSKDLTLRKKMLRTLEMCYKKAPYFDFTYSIAERVLMNEEQNLAKFLVYSIREICNYLGIQTELIFSSSLEKNNSLKGNEKVLDICGCLGAGEYINAIGGQSLYSISDFAAKGIRLVFLKSKTEQYKQFNSEFIPNLSIIDVMMFNSVAKIKQMLGEYELL